MLIAGAMMTANAATQGLIITMMGLGALKVLDELKDDKEIKTVCKLSEWKRGEK